MAMNDKKQQGDQRTEGDLQEKLVQVNRVAKTVKLSLIHISEPTRPY